jgi:hypothetical protein
MMLSRVASSLRGPTVLLVMVNALALWACGTRLWHGSTAQVILATPPQRIAPPPTLQDPISRSIDLSSVQSAALFYESRSFYTAPAIPEIKLPPDYRLAGTWMPQNQLATAVLVHNPSGTRIKAQQGSDIEGWMVESITAQIVMLRYGEQHIEIRTARRATAPGMQAVSSSATETRTRGSGSGVKLLGQPFAPASPMQSGSHRADGPSG